MTCVSTSAGVSPLLLLLLLLLLLFSLPLLFLASASDGMMTCAGCCRLFCRC